MKILLRSCFTAKPTDNKDAFTANYHRLKATGLGFLTTQDEVIWRYVQDFVTDQVHVPDFATLQLHFTRLKETEILDRLVELSTLTPCSGGDFIIRLNEKVLQRKTKAAGDILREAAEILTNGLELPVPDGRKNDKKILRGPEDSIKYVMDRGHEIVTPTTGIKLSGNVVADTVDFLAEYDRMEENPLSGIGCFTGIEQIDIAINGAKRQELWIHAAFTGGLKSTWAMSWAYNQSIFYRNNVLFFSLEMPYQQCRRLLVTMHSAHRKFKDVHRPLKYDDVKLAKLTPEQKDFLKLVAQDLDDGWHSGEYGALQIEVADPEKQDFNMADLRSRSELLHSQNPASLLFIDHLGLMASRGRYGTTTERLNEVCRDAKKLASNFNKGEGIAVVGLFQTSREGWKTAEKNGGLYNLTSLSYANEAERSADIVTASWVDADLRKRCQVLFQNLKSRDQAMFDPFYASVQWDCRRIRTLRDSGATSETISEDIQALMEELNNE